MTTDELEAFLGDRVVGRVRRDRHGRLSFSYDDRWRVAPNAYPLSLSMPLAAREHKHAAIDAYLWGLLPDNEAILERWARRFHVSARNAVALLTHVGQDCPGAVRFVLPANAARLTPESQGEIEWLDTTSLAERVRALRNDASAWRKESDEGQFSLGGAQAKTALLFDGRRWGVPSGRLATTHILKPGMRELEGHAENEHFCLVLARELGLPTASSSIVSFENEVAVSVARYDRLRTTTTTTTTKAKAAEIVRVHQEDMCQALGVSPTRKYESEGGPGARAIADVLRNHSSAADEDVHTFVDALAYAWLIGGTDAHAKNYSVLFGASGRVRLAPLYDLASVLPHHELRYRKLKLAMKIGGTYRLHEIGRSEWDKLAKELRLDVKDVRARVASMASKLPHAAARTMRGLKRDGLKHPIIAQLAARLSERASECETLLVG